MIDLDRRLGDLCTDDLACLLDEIKLQSGKRFTEKAADAMLAVLNADVLTSLNDKNIKETAARLIPAWEVSVGDDDLLRLAELAARIIDNKSAFTKKHTVQISNRAWLMSGYYGFDAEKRAKVYLAASLHDIGKIAVT
jgi:HD-GYP domain-containing protein (c-di-GMP phosphodiesterase class II)